MPALPPNDAVPDARVLARELRHVVNQGAWASALDPAELRNLLTLQCVASPAQEDSRRPEEQLVIVLQHPLRPEKGRDDQHPLDRRTEVHRALDLLLGLASTKGLDAVTRRQRTMQFMNYAPDKQHQSFYRRQVPRLLNVLADELVEYDRTYRLRDTHDRLAAKLPASPALAVLWLDRFQYYYRIWSDLSGLETDLTVYLRVRHDVQTTASQLETRRRTALWYLARFFLHLDQFIDQRGGLWLLGDEEQAQRVADAVGLLNFHPPCTEQDRSWLSFAALEQPVPAFHLFTRKLDEDDAGTLILARWRAWLDACQCDGPAPAKDCELHIVLQQCGRYMETIDSEWNRIVAWFTGPPGKSVITPEQVAEMNLRWRIPVVAAVDG